METDCPLIKTKITPTKELDMETVHNELEDYSGNFQPDLKLTDFSKDALIRLWHVAGRNYAGRVGQWYSFIRDKFDEETAQEVFRDIWMKKHRSLNIECRRVAEAMNIQDRNVAGFFKFLQWDPAQTGIINTHCGLVNENPSHGIATIPKCWVVDFCEQSDDESMEIEICDSCLYGYEECARWFNPNIKTVCLKLPPRTNPNEICCQWEFFIPGEI